jgi:hypothetical protein
MRAGSKDQRSASHVQYPLRRAEYILWIGEYEGLGGGLRNNGGALNGVNGDRRRVESHEGEEEGEESEGEEDPILFQPVVSF